MDLDALIILFIVFSFIARVIGEATKGKKGPPGQQLPRPPQRPRPGVSQPTQRPGVPQPTQRPATDQPPERAADMIPDELWQILTGQPRPLPTPPPRQQLPPTVPTEADTDEELERDEESAIAAEAFDENRQVEELIRRRRRAEQPRQQSLDRYEPVVVSLETEPLPTPARHIAFHERFQPHVPIVTGKRTAPNLARFAGVGPHPLRRAIVLQEVLGRPKGLE